LLVAVLPEVAQVLFDGPRAAGFQVRTAESDETLAVFRGEIFLRVQPQVLRTGSSRSARRPPGEATREWVASLALTVAPPHGTSREPRQPVVASDQQRERSGHKRATHDHARRGPGAFIAAVPTLTATPL